MTDSTAAQPAEVILAYHRRTKHHLHRYARSAGFLDWDNQPDPFRTFTGAPTVELPLLADALTASYADLHQPGRVRPRRPDRDTVAILLELSLGLSAWKEAGASRWALRCNPSSGNLHPTEGYVIAPSLPGLPAGVYHYVSRDHRLERRCTFTLMGTERLAASLSPDNFLVGFSSVHWREAWKYGERAYRYCQHDVGHALAALRYAAGVLGWSARLLDHLGDDEVAGWLGLQRSRDFAGIAPQDREHPDVLLLVGPPPLATRDPDRTALDQGSWAGAANALSPEHLDWSLIEEAARAAWKPRTTPTEFQPAALPPLPCPRPIPAAALIRQRRSCLALDGRTGLEAGTFYTILDHLLPRPEVPPWDVLPGEPNLHLALFVHRVHGIPSGLYLLERNATDHEALRAAFSSRFVWDVPVNCPAHLRLFRLDEGDYRAIAQRVSCHQEIAGEGAFSLGMLAPLPDRVRRRGPWWYRRLFHEAGVLGQVLYLEAESAGVRGTGIGCYFDDTVHQVLGLKDEEWQSLYHFTLGGPIDDPRLRTIAPYAHLER